jgi:hypothetical protein
MTILMMMMVERDDCCITGQLREPLVERPVPRRRGAGGTSKAVRAKVLVCRLWSWASETLVGQKSRPCGEKDAKLGTCDAAPLRP